MTEDLYPEASRPDFIVIGAVKAATTWIQKQLQRDPTIYLPGPEPHYFSSDYERGPGFYARFFEDASDEVTLKGEKSADYLAHPDAAARIARHVPDARLVVQFRDPVQRAYSDYKMLYRRGTVKGPPEDYLTPGRDSAQPRFLADGLYGRHLARWLDLFPAEQLLAFLFEDVKSDPEGVLARVTGHIGARAAPLEGVANAKRENDSSARLLPLGLRRLLQPLKPAVAPLRGNPLFESARATLAREVRYPPLAPDLEARIREHYLPDIEKLEGLIGRDLSAWKSGRESKGQREAMTPPAPDAMLVHGSGSSAS